MEKNTVNYGLGLASNTVRGLRGGLLSLFGLAVAENLIDVNPVVGTKIPPPPQSSANPLTLDEAWAFVSAEYDCWYRDAFIFNLHTGLRPEELMALIRNDVDFVKGTLKIERACKWIESVFVEFGTTKSIRSARTIELAQEHLQFLQGVFERQDEHIFKREQAGLIYGEPKIHEWLGRERSNQKHLYKDLRLIFPKRSGGVPNSSTVRELFKNMLRCAGFKGDRLKVRWYDLRHTHATYLLILGVPEHEVAARLGHSVDTLRRFYSHILPDRQRKASSMFVNLVPTKESGPLSVEDIRRRVHASMNTSDEEIEVALSHLLNSKIK